MKQDVNTEANVEVAIQELRLRPGTELTLLDSKGNVLPHKAQFIAVFVGKSILVSMLVDDIRKIALHEGETYQIKGFTGIYDFSFGATVLQVDQAQFNARMTCPNTVYVIFVRSHLRVQITLPSNVMLENVVTPIVINDLSAGGAGLDSKVPLGAIGDRIQMALPVEFDKKKITLNLASEIRHISETEKGLKTGVEFVETSQHDKLMLHYFVNTVYDIGAAI
jgi:c-di-GMP-binding flagellar brake protein YcgR